MDRLSGAFWAELPETYSRTDKRVFDDNLGIILSISP